MKKHHYPIDTGVAWSVEVFLIRPYMMIQQVDQLREELGNRGLDTKGNKAELQERLQVRQITYL